MPRTGERPGRALMYVPFAVQKLSWMITAILCLRVPNALTQNSSKNKTASNLFIMQQGKTLL